MADRGKHATIVAIFVLAILGGIGLSKLAFADTLSNPGFEDPNLLNGAMSLTIPGWMQEGDGSGNVYNVASGRSQLPQPVEGYNVGVMYFYNQTDYAQHIISQPPVSALAVNTEYQLTFSIGNPKGRIYLGKWTSSSALTVTVYFVAGTDLNISNAVGQVFSMPLADIGPGTFQQHSISFDTSDAEFLAGQPLSVVFRVENNGTPVGLAGCYIDNVRLCVIQ